MISEPNRISFEVNQTKLIPNRIRGFLKKTKTENEIKKYIPHIPSNDENNYNCLSASAFNSYFTVNKSIPTCP